MKGMTVITIFLSEASTVGARTRGKSGERRTDKNKGGASQNLMAASTLTQEKRKIKGSGRKQIKHRRRKRRGKNGRELLEITEQTVQESKMTHLWAKVDR